MHPPKAGIKSPMTKKNIEKNRLQVLKKGMAGSLKAINEVNTDSPFPLSESPLGQRLSQDSEGQFLK